MSNGTATCLSQSNYNLGWLPCDQATECACALVSSHCLLRTVHLMPNEYEDLLLEASEICAPRRAVVKNRCRDVVAKFQCHFCLTAMNRTTPARSNNWSECQRERELQLILNKRASDGQGHDTDCTTMAYAQYVRVKDNARPQGFHLP